MELRDLTSRMSRLFGPSLFDTLPAEEGTDLMSSFADWVPRVNVNESPKEYRLSVELPAIDREDVRVNVQGGLLTIEGERRRTQEEGDDQARRVESFYGSFRRRFTLPDDANPEGIEAKLDRGMLTVRLPKIETKGAPEPRSIDIG